MPTRLMPSLILLLSMMLCAHADLLLIPQPRQVEDLAGRFEWSEQVAVAVGDADREANEFAAKQLGEELARNPQLGGAPGDETPRAVSIGRLSDDLIRPMVDADDLAALADRGPEAYLLLVQPTRIIAAGNGPAGTFYAIQTLKQLIRANRRENAIPCVRILDWPGLRYRGYSDDISRGPIPTMEFFKRQIRTAAEFKMNMLTLYTEHVFKLEKHPIIAPDDGITAAEIRELDAYARKHHVELVGNFQSFGHFAHILKHEEYAHLRETSWVITPAKEESYEFLDDAYSEIAPAYESKLFNVNCDETWGLGEGPSKPLADEIGVGGVYVRHMNRIHDILKDTYGKRMMMWGDIALKHPKIVQQLAADTILLSWGYGARESYDGAIEPFTKAGFEFMVCPGISCWSRVFPYYDNAAINIQNYVRDGAKLGALGMLNTTWDDDGENLFHWNFYGTNWGAACAWRPEDSDLDAYNSAYAQLSYGAPDDKIMRAIELLNACAHNPITQGSRDRGFWVRPTSPLAASAELVLKQAADLCGKTGEAIALLNAAKAETTLDAEDLDYIIFAARRLHYIGRWRQLAHWAARRYTEAVESRPDTGPARDALDFATWSTEELVVTIEELRAEYQRLWLAENRPWWLDRMRGKYDSLLHDLNANLQRLVAARAELDETGVPPEPNSIGLLMAEIGRRNVRPAPAAEELLPGDAPWWDQRWPHRIPLRVEMPDRGRTDYPIEVRVDFAPHEPAPDSVRVVEHKAGGEMAALPTQFDPAHAGIGHVVFLLGGETPPESSRTFAIYYDLEADPGKPVHDIDGVSVRKDGGWHWVENSRYRVLVGTHGAHIFEWYVKALGDLEITHPGRGGWSGFADSGRRDRDAGFKIAVEAAGPLMARLRATSAQAGSEKVLTFYAGQPYVEVMLAHAVDFYWDYDNVENFAKDRGNPGAAIFSNGHSAPVPGAAEQVHAAADGVTWGAKTREDGLVLANITPEVKGRHVVGPGGGWGGVGIERSKPATHFVVLADKVSGDPAAIINAVASRLDMRDQPKLWIGKSQTR